MGFELRKEAVVEVVGMALVGDEDLPGEVDLLAEGCFALMVVLVDLLCWEGVGCSTFCRLAPGTITLKKITKKHCHPSPLVEGIFGLGPYLQLATTRSL